MWCGWDKVKEKVVGVIVINGDEKSGDTYVKKSGRRKRKGPSRRPIWLSLHVGVTLLFDSNPISFIRHLAISYKKMDIIYIFVFLA